MLLIYEPQRNKKYKEFINKTLNLTPKMKENKIKKLKFDNRILITGSDQVWNTNLTGGFDNIYFLNFGSNVKKISYAASIGTMDVNTSYKKEIKDALNSFDYISVREETGKKALQEIIRKNIDVVLDPTLLLSENDWKKYIPNIDSKNNEYILVYTANDTVVRIANYLAKKENLKIVNLDRVNKYGKLEVNKYGSTPFEFLELVKNAKYVITISFHATVFSIIFNKNFWVNPDLKVSSRIVDLLKKIKLEDRIVKDYNNFLEKNENKEINYEYVNKIITTERSNSLKKLKDNLK